jgi:coproporphyrinogen III oxidase-like Fe-S oxidoreductase
LNAAAVLALAGVLAEKECIGTETIRLAAQKALEEFRAQGLLEIDDARLRLTGKGMLLSNEVLECFI